MIIKSFELGKLNQQKSNVILLYGDNEGFKNQIIKEHFIDKNKNKKVERYDESEILGNYVSSKVKEKAITSMSNISEEIYRQVIKCLITFDRYRDFKNISVPCCLIAGEEDKNAPSLTMQKMASQLHKAEFHIIKKAGHLVNLEKPRVVNKILLTEMYGGLVRWVSFELI